MSEQVHRVLGVTGRKHGDHKDDGAYLRCNSSSIHYEGFVGYFLGHYNRVVLDKFIIHSHPFLLKYISMHIDIAAITTMIERYP